MAEYFHRKKWYPIIDLQKTEKVEETLFYQRGCNEWSRHPFGGILKTAQDSIKRKL